MLKLLVSIILSAISIPLLLGQEERQQDTTSNGLEIVRQQKDTLPKPDTLIYSWKYADNSFIKLYAEFDTTLMAIMHPEIYRREWAGFVYLGNLGTPVQHISFFERRKMALHWQIRNFYPYISSHQKQKYYNTKTPYTQMHYVSASEDWEYFTFNHTQNYNKHVNLGLNYEIYESEGYVIFQKSRNRSLGFWTDIDYDRYKMYGSINFNDIKINENGGIRSDYFLDDAGYSLQEINTKLNNANTNFSYFDGAVDQQLKVSSLGRDTLRRKGLWLSHHFSFNKMQHLYTDIGDDYTLPNTTGTFNFYDHTYNGTSSNDTVAFSDFKNRVAITYQSGGDTRTEIGPFIEHHNIDVSNLYRDTLFTYNNDTTYQTYSVGAQATIKKEDNFGIDFQLLYYPFEGYNHENYQFTANFVKWQPLNRDTLYMHLQLYHQEKAPDYLLSHYYSNHFKWNKKLNDENERKLLLNMRLLNARLNLEFTANHIQNYIYFNKNMRVDQHGKEIMVFGAKLTKDFTFWKKFNFNVNLLGQYTATEFIDVPDLSVKGNFYFNHTFHFNNTGGQLTMYAGFAGRMHTKYHAPSYVPSTAQFCLQEERLIGNYPIIDIFAGARIKRFIFFLRLEHANSGIRGTSYYSALHYPIRPRNLRFGVSWNFYN